MPKKSAAAAARFVDPAAAAAAAPNTVYSIDYVEADDNNEIVIKQGTDVIHSIPLSQLRRVNGFVFQSTAELIKEQQGWNYLDSIKDGINIQLLKALNIYPLSGEPQFTELHTWENKIIAQVNSNLSRRTWTKLYHTQKKDKIFADYYLWESGMGKEHFMNTDMPTSTFGSFIDPLNKPGIVWPPVGEAIYLTQNFMKAIGFGMSSIYAETIGNNEFKYCMKIECGDPCTGNKCIMNDYTQDQKFMKGNNEKATMLKESGRGQDKTKFVVIKEWGDKSQVVVDCILYHVMKKKNKEVVMSTCDIVVFVLCIIFGIRCVFTGTFERPVNIDTRVLQAGKGSHYSIIDYFPGTPFENEYQRLEQKITKTLEENRKIIASMEYLRANPSIEISVQGTHGTTFTTEFYDNIVKDMELINTELKDTFGPSITTKKKDEYESDITTNKITMDDAINKLRLDSKIIDNQYLLVPIIKQKNNKLYMTLGKSYTLSIERREKPSFNSTDTFYNIGRRMNKIGQTGGAIPTRNDLEKFPKSNHAPVQYIDQKQHQMYDTTRISEMDEKMTENELPAAYEKDDKIYETDLQNILDRNFSDSFTSLYRNKIKKNDLLYDSLYETLYTLYIYEAERDGMASPHITPIMITNLSQRHEVSIQIRSVHAEKYRRPNVQSPTKKHPSGRSVYTRPSPVPGIPTIFHNDIKQTIFRNPRSNIQRKLIKTLSKARRIACTRKIKQRRAGPAAPAGQVGPVGPIHSASADVENLLNMPTHEERRRIAEHKLAYGTTEEKAAADLLLYGPPGESSAAAAGNSATSLSLIPHVQLLPTSGMTEKELNEEEQLRQFWGSLIRPALPHGGKRTAKHRKRNKTKKNRR